MDQELIPRRVKTRTGVVELCARCNTPLPKAHAFQAPDNVIYKKRECPNCGALYMFEGPFRSFAEAGVVSFK